jgi:hypothetical protein
MKLVLLVALLAAVWAHEARADKKTVCTITVNSPDEKDTFQRNLPQDEFQFVELVERGRPDWLASACRKGIRCDVLLVSGHFDGGTEFYSDRLDVREFLPVDEMERVSCSDSCPGLFSQLKEVYLFGCNTLNAEALHHASAEIARSLVRSGHSQADAEQLSRVLNERHGESNLDHMRQIFKDVPVIYGFSSKAPLGATAAPILDRYFQAGPGGEIGSGRASAKLLGLFAASSMTVAAGLRDADPHAEHRQDVCRFSDDRSSSAEKLGFVHQLLKREMAEVRMFLGRIEKLSASLETERQVPEVSRAFDEIARDEVARTRYLEFARDTDKPAVRARMMEVARNLGWLSPADQRADFLRMISDRLARNSASSAEVDLACALGKGGEFEAELQQLQLPLAQSKNVTHAALLACLGSTEDRARVLRALTGPKDEDVQIAQIYLHHRPLADVDELRVVAAGIARMNDSNAQVHALDTLARQRILDGESLEALTRLYPLTKSADVQRAIAGVLVRSDYRAIAKPELVRALRQHRLKSPGGEDMIDVLLRRLSGALASGG